MEINKFFMPQEMFLLIIKMDYGLAQIIKVIEKLKELVMDVNLF
jgi:hypothetical protein